MFRSLIDRIDRFLVLLASPFGVNVVDPLHRYGLLLGMYAGIALIAVVGPPVLALAVLVYGLLGIFAVQRAWKVNEDLRVAIYRNLTTGRADDLPDLRGFALLSALQLLLIFPLLFRSLNQTFFIFSAPEEAGFGSWFAFSFDRFCKSLLDWSEIYGIHFTEITAQGVYGRHWIMFKSLTIDVILIQAGLRLLQIHGLRREAVEALPRDPLGIVRLGRRALAPLLWVIDSSEGDQRLGAIQALGYYSEPTVREKLLALAMDAKQPAPHRAMATLSLGQHGNPDVVDSLRKLAEDADPAVRAAAIEALGRFATPELFEWFMRVYLNDANVDVRRAALGVLERLATDETTRHLITGLRDLTSSNSRVRGSAAQSLGELGDRRAVVPLSQLAATDFAEGGEWGKVSVTAVYALKDLAIERVPGALEALQDLLRHPDAELRGEVASVFSEIVDRRAIPSLLAALQDPNEDVRCNSANSLGELRDPQALPALIALLDDPEQSVSSTAVDAIASIQGPGTVESLIRALDHGISDAGYRLANYPEPQVVDALLRGLRSASNDVRESSADALNNLAGIHPQLLKSLGVAEALRAALRDSYEGVRAPVAEGLGKLCDAASVDALLGRLRDTDWVREQVVIALGRIGDERARESLLHVVAEDGMGSTRAAAATALGRIRGAGVCSALCRALADPESEVREKAATALGLLNDAQALPALEQRVGEDPEATVRQAAMIALGQCGTADSLGVLITALADEAPVRKSAISLSAVDAVVALAGRGVPVREPLLEALAAAAEDTLASRITAALKKLPLPQVQPALEAALRDPRVGLRNRVAILLGEHCPVASAAALREALADPAPEVRARAAWALGSSHSREAIPALVALLSDQILNPGESYPPAAWAAEALGKLQALDTAEALVQAARSADPLLRGKAIQALGVLPLTSVPPVLMEALQDSNADIRCLAAQAIGRIGDPAAIPALTARLTDAAVPSWGDTTVQVCAALALGELRDRQAAEPLLQLLQQEAKPLRAVAARALALLYEPRAVPPVLQSLSLRNLTDQPIAEFSDLLDRTQLPESFETLSRLIYRNAAVVDTFYALARLGDPRATEPFRFAHLAQRKKNADVAIWGLALTPGEDAYSYLVDLTRHEKPWTRGSAAHALGYRGEPAALEVLLRLVEDHAVRGTGSVAQSAIESLGYLPADERIDARFHEILPSSDPACCRAICSSLFWQRCPRTVAALRARLAKEWREPDSSWVSQALYALAAARDSAAVPLMAEMLDDPNERFSETALLTLGFLGDASAEPLLRRRLDAANPWHRGSAIVGLTLLGAPVEATEWQARLEREEFGFVRSVLKLALHARGRTIALPDLSVALRSEGWWAAAWLAAELPLPKEPRVVRDLTRLIEASNTNRYLIALGVAQLARQPGELAAAVVRKYARSHYPRIRRAATEPLQASRITGRLIPSAG